MILRQFSNSFPKTFQLSLWICIHLYPELQFCEYLIIFHCLHCSPSCFDPELPSLCILLAWAILD